ncbi:MAG TPA: sigma-70 family RNA polymerase sigma factor [Thermoanaerobaculia bacterium]|nr:sigma-70 family RNA polymerase sigma factor [Thermoanaerobaculia bacterium]
MPETPSPAGEVTRLLRAWRQGDRGALESLIPLVYADLHRMAERRLRGERPGHTLQPTAIVNEAYLRLVGAEGQDWENRAHFFAAAARSMRRILVDHARTRQAKKRGGGGTRYLLDTTIMVEPRAVDLIAVDDALEKLAALDPEQGRVVELRFFAGLTEDETAGALGVSPATVHRKWLSAKAYLHRELAGHAS